MNARSIALTITFTAVAIASTVVRIPAIFYPGNFFQISQIPIVVAFLLFGPRIGILVGFLNLGGQLTLFPLGASRIIGYSMDFVSVVIMFVGLYVASRLLKRRDKSGKSFVWKKPILGLTASSVAFRGAIMSLLDYGLIFHLLVPLILGIHFSEEAILGLVPAFVLYNVLVALYTIPVAYVVAVKVGNYLHIEPYLLSQV